MPIEKIYKYPSPDKMQICESDLRLELRDYCEAVETRFSVYDLLIVVPAWIPIFASEFNGVGSVSGSFIRGCYAMVVILGTIFWLFRIHALRKLLNKSEEWKVKNEIDPDIRARNIKSQCK